jgi:hypothetical protein
MSKSKYQIKLKCPMSKGWELGFLILLEIGNWKLGFTSYV